MSVISQSAHLISLFMKEPNNVGSFIILMSIILFVLVLVLYINCFTIKTEKEKVKNKKVTLGNPVTFKAKNILTGQEKYYKGVVTQVRPDFLPPSIQITSLDKKMWGYYKLEELGINWWLGFEIASQKDLLKLWATYI